MWLVANRTLAFVPSTVLDEYYICVKSYSSAFTSDNQCPRISNFVQLAQINALLNP